jgi:hypothetical protein
MTDFMGKRNDFAATRSASGMLISGPFTQPAAKANGAGPRLEGGYHDEASRWKRSQPVQHLRGTRTVSKNTLTGCDSPLSKHTVAIREDLTVPPHEAFRARHARSLHPDDMRKVAAREIRLHQPPYADPQSYQFGMLQVQSELPNRQAFSCPQREDERTRPVDKADFLRTQSLACVERARALTALPRARTGSSRVRDVSGWDSTHRNVTRFSNNRPSPQPLWRPPERVR